MCAAKKKPQTEKKSVIGLVKCPTGIAGLDDITKGGLPQGRPTLVCGGAGSGKTLLAMEFLVRGAVELMPTLPDVPSILIFSTPPIPSINGLPTDNVEMLLV